MEDRRVADYFVVAGLDRNQLLPLEEFSNEAITKPTSRLDPITDITVINRSLGEKVPKGFECIEQTPTGYPANLNHGSIRCPDMFICYRRGRDKPPLKDLGILYEGKERVMDGCEIVSTTMEGHPANVNNSNSSRTYVTFRRADKSAPSDTLVVVDICVILGSRGEEPPLTFLKILKNLNKGMLGSDVFLCYKKAMVKTDVLAYKASILGRYPLEDREEFPLPESVPMFCLPMGATIECWSADAQHPVPSFSTFILTGAGGEKVYGAAVSFYEEHKEENLTDMQMRALGLKNKHIRQQFHILKTVHVRKSIALLSHWPFFDAFKKFLSQLYKISITGPHTVPMERHISHFMYDVPYPSPERPRILVQLTHDSISLCMPEDSPLPQSGASFITLLRNLGPELTMNLLLFVLLENKILLHSLRPTVLTEVAEAVSMMIFPFHWQCPYIPLCPLGLSDVLNAPCPFIVGVDSRYFDLYDPPPDVICVDLDTSRISPPEDKKSLSFKNLPKKPSRVMLESLSKLYEEASQPSVHKHGNDEVSLEMTHFDLDFRRKKQDMQLEFAIQEVFLRFTACLLKDYKNFLNPIMKQPNSRTTDASSLFDMQGFLKSRDKANTKFFSQLMHTQMFFRFIEERSFVSDKDASLAFFDECAEKVDETSDTPKLIEIDNSQMSERTVFIMPPEPVNLPEGVKYSYNGFPELNQELFLANKKSVLPVPTKATCPNSPLARRTKQEVKSAQKVAQQQVGNPKLWAKCLVSYCYSLWFVVFPAFVQARPKKIEALKIGFAVLRKMQEAKLITVDELCYRVLMQLAGQYNKPGLAVQVFSQMKKNGVQPNAITYGYYNKVMLEAKWPSPQSKGRLRWLKIRNVIIGVAQFRRAIRRRSISIYSNSGSEFDQISHTSVDSYLGESKGDKMQPTQDGGPASDDLNTKCTASLEERMSTGGVSDRGYNSMTQEDVRHLAQIVMSVSLNDGNDKPKGPTWNPLKAGGKSRHSDKPKKDVHILSDRQHRPRVGSIVKRSISSIQKTHVSDMETLKGSILVNSCGLVMLSKACLEKSVVSPDLQLEEVKRRRHRSAGESKPGRSMSLFASWMPQTQRSSAEPQFTYSQLLKNDADSQETCQAQSYGTQTLSSPSEASSHIPESENPSTNTTDHHQVNNSSCSCKESDHLLITIKENDECLSSREPTEASPDPTHTSSQDISATPDPTHTSSQDISATPDPTHTSSQDISATPDPTHTSSQDISATPDPTHTSSQDISATPDPTHTSSQDIIATSDPTHTSSQDISATPDPTHTSSQDISATPDPTHTSSQDISATPDPTHTSSQDISATPDPTHTSSQDISATPDPTHTSSQDINATPDPTHTSSQDISATPDPTHTSSQDINATPDPTHTSSLDRKLREKGETISVRREIRRSVSIPEDRLSGQLSEALMKQSLSESGHTLSSPGLPEPAVGQQPEDTQSISSLTDQKRPSEFLFKRTQSLKKTNEKIGTFLKYASYASKAAFSKLNELKQTISTPIKNGSLGSLASLSQSVEELDASSTSGTLRERLKHGGSQDLLTPSEDSDPEDTDKRLSGLSLESVPSPSILEYSHFKDVSGGPAIGSASDKSSVDLINVAMEVEMSSCSRCTKCNRLLYDEEIMAGWSAEDSNLNTSCPYCHAKFVPHLQVYIKDWRADAKSFTFNNEQAYPASEKLLAIANKQNLTEPSSLDRGEMPLSMEEAELTMRRRCTSECLISELAGSNMDSPSHQFQRSPLSLSIEEESSDSSPEKNCMKKEFMSRSASSSEPVVVPYLSPLVLRKEVEYVLDHESNLCLASDGFVEEHPIIFWNLIWFFRRIEVPTHLIDFLLTSKIFNSHHSTAGHKGVFSSQNILIRPQWDNVRIHDEAGLPMYSAWRAGHKSTVVDALVIESESFSRPLMWQIIASIKRNDVSAAIRQLVAARRKMNSRKRRFRSMYREILFLSFAECGRENIDHDAFDREYSLAFETKLQAADIRRLQVDDHPKSEKVQWCRKVFGELEV
ncbi:C-myc promoter-binding protein-like isoform X1 [Physella acuta]|nr:C-myc promoter-binding protein-like isoform X1 [Physella acuta]XP_059175158.1 C-myc promoter-binding protein-like isoform X1 [Physella acuta]XP_059175166.1 C-myc promoter-binding protein-like isoform X1 [Physella acuta]XP_059175175.1 C-myc promoter-binding protein-like isoform X1 [Physella acuta]XP_059175184.1 C-myc promoter-binding protein-like isoform X1 [Physella acuta]